MKVNMKIYNTSRLVPGPSYLENGIIGIMYIISDGK